MFIAQNLNDVVLTREDEKEGFFEVYSSIYGQDLNTRNLILKIKDDFCKNICDEEGYVHDASDTIYRISVKKLRKSQAYDLQKLLFDKGLVDVSVTKM